ncbi:uncharacterized protein BO80DRAFT_470127 [Aspergillus ibericus CBS 121593]|uniref:Uncharacterized protein n=1 Tax=Aspergillus ibericus CBS 121593 TaxID=1448316 RepID=A0A395HGU8_9EURO|nr:hypothetical protein BO80DRAFT_470127 [Aspergillus ibericus CBS 121593]RAL06198.1 hypothetical protein BO80DRAFT_470127 [Aspergillus ibericus CBS 121593]
MFRINRRELPCFDPETFKSSRNDRQLASINAELSGRESAFKVCGDQSDRFLMLALISGLRTQGEWYAELRHDLRITVEPARAGVRILPTYLRNPSKTDQSQIPKGIDPTGTRIPMLGVVTDALYSVDVQLYPMLAVVYVSQARAYALMHAVTRVSVASSTGSLISTAGKRQLPRSDDGDGDAAVTYRHHSVSTYNQQYDVITWVLSTGWRKWGTDRRGGCIRWLGRRGS